MKDAGFTSLRRRTRNISGDSILHFNEAQPARNYVVWAQRILAGAQSGACSEPREGVTEFV